MRLAPNQDQGSNARDRWSAWLIVSCTTGVSHGQASSPARADMGRPLGPLVGAGLCRRCDQRVRVDFIDSAQFFANCGIGLSQFDRQVIARLGAAVFGVVSQASVLILIQDLGWSERPTPVVLEGLLHLAGQA